MPGLPQPGAEWAGFHVEQQIGAGGYGQVFVAWDPALERRVAIKALPADAGETAKERFLRESKIAGGLDHPRIIPILRAAEQDGVPYIVMRHVPGGDLRQQIHVSPLTLERAASVIGQVADALDHAHRHGLVHRDVKPANILCAAGSDDIYLTDFGITRDLAQTADAALTATGETMASPHYAAPEQLRGEEVQPATDTYGLGCTLFEALTGRVPFPGETSQVVAGHHLHSDPPRVTDLRPDLPAELDDIVATALAKDPQQRHPDARSLADALARVATGDDAPGGPAAVAAAGSAVAAAAGVTAGTEPTRPVSAAAGDATVPEGRSVFDAPATGIAGPVSGGDTEALPVVPTNAADGTAADDAGWDDDGTVDGAAFGVYEDDAPRRRTPAIVGGLLLVAALVVAALVWRAVNTDAELALPGSSSGSPTTADPDVAPEPPTEEALRDLVPAGVTSCVVPPGSRQDSGGGSGDSTPTSVALECPMDGVPELLTLELFPSTVERDAELDAVVGELDVPDRDDAECALGRLGRHVYEAGDRAGTVACQAAGGKVDFVWTRDDAPVLLRATGGGRFVDYERSWDELAERTDARFPVAEEQRLLDALPDDLLDGCRRDLGLALEAAGEVAAACEPADAEPSVVSWVQFGDATTMHGWLDERRASLENTFDPGDDGCTPDGFGRVEDGDDDEGPGNGRGRGRGGGDDDEDEPPAPDAAVGDYDIEGSSGRILCFLNSSGQNVLFWIRDGSRIGSIAVSDIEDGRTMPDLLRWWRDDGHRP